jgi:hypothetical protein
MVKNDKLLEKDSGLKKCNIYGPKLGLLGSLLVFAKYIYKRASARYVRDRVHLG